MLINCLALGLSIVLWVLHARVADCRENETRKVMFQNSKIETKGSEIENNDSKFETEGWTKVRHRREL